MVGVLLGALLAAALNHQNLLFVLQRDGLVYGFGFLFLAWFLGGYSYLSWPWIPFHQLVQRWLLVVGSAIGLGWLFQSSTQLAMGLVLALWGLLVRRWLQPLAKRHQEPATLQKAEETQQDRQLLLLLVAYHPSPLEVERLQACLAELPAEVGYAVVVNDHKSGEAVEQLAVGADCCLYNRDNPGYGRAVNRLVAKLGVLPPYVGVLNTDLSWQKGCFETLLAWLQVRQNVS